MHNRSRAARRRVLRFRPWLGPPNGTPNDRETIEPATGRTPGLLVPRTESGRWSLGLIAAFVAGLSCFALGVATGQRGGEGFFDNLWLTGPILAAYAAAVGAAITGLVAIVGHGERAVVVFLGVLVGSLVTLFGVLEVAFPH